MSLRSLPVLFIPFLLYFVMVMSGAYDSTPNIQAWRSLTGEEGLALMSGGKWKFTWGDVILMITMVCLFVEILKATYTSTASLVDHGLSMVLFIIALICFLMVPQAATSVFFLLLVALVIDVIAGFTIGIRVAKRDIGFGGGEQ